MRSALPKRIYFRNLSTSLRWKHQHHNLCATGEKMLIPFLKTLMLAAVFYGLGLHYFSRSSTLWFSRWRYRKSVFLQNTSNVVELTVVIIITNYLSSEVRNPFEKHTKQFRCLGTEALAEKMSLIYVFKLFEKKDNSTLKYKFNVTSTWNRWCNERNNVIYSQNKPLN